MYIFTIKTNMCICIFIYIWRFIYHMRIYIHVDTHIYRERERWRERKREKKIERYMHSVPSCNTLRCSSLCICCGHVYVVIKACFLNQHISSLSSRRAVPPSLRKTKVCGHYNKTPASISPPSRIRSCDF